MKNWPGMCARVKGGSYASGQVPAYPQQPLWVIGTVLTARVLAAQQAHRDLTHLRKVPLPTDDTLEPSEDSFETMMEPNNPSSKQMESSEGSCGTTVEASGSEAQEVMAQAAVPALAPARKEPVSGPQEELEELPTDLLQDMEEPSSGPRKEIEDPPNDLLQDVEESCNGSRQGDPRNQSSERMEEASVNLTGVQAGPRGNGDTNLEEPGEENLEEGQGQEEGAPVGAMSVIRSIISLYLRMQDLTEQQRVAEEILVTGMAAGRLPSPRRFSGDRREYHEFIVLCQLILQSCPRMFCSDQQRVHFVLSHLSGMALQWAKTLLEQNSPLMSNFPAFLEAMSEVFEYRQSLRVAEDAMFNIRQGERSATEYITEFQSLLPILRWPDEVLQAHLCQGLNEDIRHYLFRVPQPDSLDSLVVLILQIEEKLAEHRAVLRLPPEARPRNLTWIDSPAPERWMVSSWLPSEGHPAVHRAHLFLLLMVRVNPYHSVAVQALVDSGAEGNFMDEKFAQEHYVELYEKPYPQSVQCADGSLIGDEPVWLYTEPLICIHQNHQESIQFDILPSPNFSVVLGIHWLRIHAPDIDWIQGRCTFHSPYCLQNCFRPPPPCIALERHGMSLLPGLPSPYSDLADVFNPREADEETSDQPSSDGSDDLSEPEPSELQQAGDSDRSGPFHGCPSAAAAATTTAPREQARQRRECPLAVPREPVGARVWEHARQRHECWALRNMLTDRQDYIQLIPELFDQLHGAVWFTRLELRGSVVEDSVSLPRLEDMWRAAFGLELQDAKSYQPFPLSPDPVIPQRVIHFILKDMLGFFVLSSGQEVLVFSMSQEEHLQHVRQVLLRFRHHHVYCSLDRSQFHRHTAEFLGFVLTPKGVKLNKHTVSAITDYPQPTSRRGLHGFLKLLLPYRHFVERFSVIAEPLARQLLADAYDDHNNLYWGEAEQEAFDGLRRAFRRAPLLHHPKPQHQFYLQTGATSTMLHASLIQIDDQTGKRVPCAFYSRPMSPLELGASAVEMRLLPIRAAFVVWCRYLENTEEPIMILLNTEDLASLNNDRLTVLLPGHWVFFFSHFHFDVMERPEQDGEGQSQLTPPGCNPRGSRSPRSLLLFAARRSRRGPSGNGEDAHDTDEEDEDMPDLEDEAAEQNLARELLALIPAHQILHSFLAHFSMAQIRAVVLHFFRGLLYWKSVLGLAAMLVLLRARRRRLCLPPAPPPTPPSPSASAPQRHSLRLILDSSLLAGSGMATAAVQLLTQMPPLMGANTLPAHELLELFLGPGPWRHHALLPATHRGLHFTPGFWLMLCEFFGFRVTPPGRDRSSAATTTVPPRHFRYLELHVVGDEDVVLREALQDDLQRYRQSGLRDGLQDTSQDARANDVPRALLPAATTDVHTDVDTAHATANTALPLRPRSLLHPEVLDFLQHRLLHIRGTDGRLTLLSQEQVARALSRFLTMASTWTPAATSESQQEPPEPEGDPEEDPDLD
ncbi:retrotransposon-like protein 1 [Ochotona princeps]|uniref:retrotransposon-like protein 1 n=1 Tax=Ochotona princeps TaxID=9978 RepID=UPI002714EAFD|nr:retrotransposon-like protein 1 [Ochotona princeps]